MKPPFPPPQDPPGQGSERIAIRKIGAPVAVDSFFSRKSWLVRPGETFAAGSTLGKVTVALPDRGDNLLVKLGLWYGYVIEFLESRGRMQPCPVIAPEDGVLTWCALDDRDIRIGKPIAAYIPLVAWQEYVQLLTEHEQRFQKRSTGRQQTAAAAVSDSLSGKLDAMIARVNAISAREIRDDETAVLPRLVQRIRRTVRAACPVTPEDIAPIYHRYFCLIQSIDERLWMLDNHYSELRCNPTLSAEDADELVRTWVENKVAVIRQITDFEGG